MKIKLLQKQIDLLVNLPETGMGYQLVDIKLKDGQTFNGKVVIADEVGKIDLEKGFGEVWVVVKQKTEDLDNDVDGKTLAYVRRSDNAIYLIRDRIQDDIAISFIVRHEMGHLLGIDHTNRYLMYPYFSWSWFKCVDQITAGKIAKEWGFRI